MTQKLNERLHWTTVMTEKIMLGGIGCLTVLAACLDVYDIFLERNIELADLFLLFIYWGKLVILGLCIYIALKVT